ncbi:antitoxin Xre/MbcA/ParS toxin-binding domain-containing protein [Zhongshania borealis]|uniref:Antitoxin Xre/MbcA/ParS-like toxin-binding domain-containing protein n=1 Tax=Zhongshania borealis TaxID=889488 RepID=A0ABP7WM68_9GAMM
MVIPVEIVGVFGFLALLLTIVFAYHSYDDRSRYRQLKISTQCDEFCDVSSGIDFIEGPSPRNDAEQGSIFVIILEQSSKPGSDLIAVVRDGIAFSSLELLSKATGLSDVEIAESLYISDSALYMACKKGRFPMFESERILRMAHIFDCAVDFFNAETDSVADWLKAPNMMLGGNVPINVIGSEVGARSIENLLRRRDNGWLL